MKLYMTETTLGIVAALILSTAAHAFPAHQKDGYRDTGCDPAMFTDILTKDGRVAYRNNPTCPSVGGGASPFFTAANAVTPAPVEPEEPTEPEEPVTPIPSCKSKKGCK